MTNNYLFTIIAAIALQNVSGFTFNLKTKTLQTSGFAVAAKETQNSFNASGLSAVIEFAKEKNIDCVGGWLDSESGNYYFDATYIVSDREEAILIGSKNDQLAIFDIDNCEEIRL